jgi:Bacterial lectin
MGKLRTLFAAAMLLVVTGVAQCAVIDEADWTLRDLSKAPVNWVLNGNARLALNPASVAFDPIVTLRLLENRGGQSSTAWHRLKGHVDSFTFIADVRIQFEQGSFPACPADGMTLAFANADLTAVGAGGGSLAIFNAKKAAPDFIAFEINSWRDQGLGTAAEKSDCPNSGKNETFAFDVIRGGNAKDRGGNPSDPATGGGKIGQLNPPPGMKLVNGGAYRYQWNVDGATNTMTLYVTGLEGANRQFQKVKVLEQKIGVPILDFDGRFGMTAATGGAVMQVDVAYTRIEVPAVP